MGKLMSKLKSKEIEETMWENQDGNFTTSKNVDVHFFLPGFSATNIATWKFHVTILVALNYGKKSLYQTSLRF